MAEVSPTNRCKVSGVWMDSSKGPLPFSKGKGVGMGKICMGWVVDVERANAVRAIVRFPCNLRNYVGIHNLLLLRHLHRE